MVLWPVVPVSLYEAVGWPGHLVHNPSSSATWDELLSEPQCPICERGMTVIDAKIELWVVVRFP